VDLRDPFTGDKRQVRLDLPSDAEPWHIEVLDMLPEMPVLP
jgi:hypothetical protein